MKKKCRFKNRCSKSNGVAVYSAHWLKIEDGREEFNTHERFYFPSMYGVHLIMLLPATKLPFIFHFSISDMYRISVISLMQPYIMSPRHCYSINWEALYTRVSLLSYFLSFFHSLFLPPPSLLHFFIYLFFLFNLISSFCFLFFCLFLKRHNFIASTFLLLSVT